MQNQIPALAFVVPCYNEEECVQQTISTISSLLKDLTRNQIIAPTSFALYVDDGSSDRTWAIIQQNNAADSSCRGLKLAGNVGHQFALYAGMMELPAEVDCIISIDADLQDDLSVVPGMLKLFIEGHDIVYGVRSDRSHDSYFKRGTADLFYKLIGLLGVRTVYQHADYRLVSKRALAALADYKEVNLFLRGIFPSMGFQTATIAYSRKPRQYGQSKYPLYKMLAFAWQGITSFSPAPLRLSILISYLTILLGSIFGLRALWTWSQGINVSGWTSLITAVLLIGGVQLLCLGIIGDYIAKIYMETKNRPRYIVEKTL